MNKGGPAQSIFKHLTGIILTQVSAKAGIQKHGKSAIDALYDEIFQLDDKAVCEGVMVSDMKPQQKRKALRAINLIKHKRCGKLKGRTVADGSTQRDLYSNAETVSRTISNDALLMTMFGNVWKKGDVTTADVTGAYLHADVLNYALLKFKGEAVDIMCKVNKI